MKDALLTYFDGERHAGIAAALVGVLGLVFAGALSLPRWDLRAFALALGVLGLVDLALGVGLYLKTGPQVTALLERLASEPAGFYASEGLRMAKVQKNFVVLELVWVAIMLGGAVTAIAQKHRAIPCGVGLALVMNAAFLLAFDLVAERRGAVYLTALREPSTPAKVIKRNPHDD